MLEVSPTVAMSQQAAALKAAGRSVLDFSVGEPDQPTPPHIAAAGAAAIAAGKTRYAPAAGVAELRAAVAHRYREDFGVSFEPAEVAITVGGKQALYLACQALLERGDEMVLPTPYWPTFAECARLAGAKPVLVEAKPKDGWAVTPRMLRGVLSPRTRAVLVNSPSNPTGAVLRERDLLGIARLARKHGVALLYDDTYARLNFEPSRPGLLAEARRILGDLFVVIGTASKTYCMTGWRIGWVLGGRALVEACTALISHSTQCPPAFAQAAAVTALTGPQERVAELRAEYLRRLEFLYPAVAGIPDLTCVRPAGGFYLFPDLRKYLSPALPTTLALGSRLLAEQGVAVVPGEGFGRPGYLRISFARSMQELELGAARIAGFLAGLRKAR
jgi:aspartate aminotransferase